jgi:hypothetical protein
MNPPTEVITSWLNSYSAQGLGCPASGIGLDSCGSGFGGCAIAFDSAGAAYVGGNVCQGGNSFNGVITVSAGGAPQGIFAGSTDSSHAGVSNIAATAAYFSPYPPIPVVNQGTALVFLIDSYNDVIWGVNSSNLTYDAAGIYGDQNNVSNGITGDYGVGSAALLYNPSGGAFTPAGHFVFSDSGDNAIRFVW